MPTMKPWHHNLPLVLIHVLGLLVANGSARYKVLNQTLSKDGKFFEFASRRDLKAPVWDIAINNQSALTDGHWCTQSRDETA
jgi:hypothetical protein